MNKVKGMSLIETIIYLALFGLIFATITQFSLSIAEANRNAEYKNAIEKNIIFIDEVISKSFEQSDAIDVNNSFFEQTNGKLKLTNSANATT